MHLFVTASGSARGSSLWVGIPPSPLPRRLRVKHFQVKRNARRPRNHRRLAFEGLARSGRPRALRIEPLESRLLLSADDRLGGAAAGALSPTSSLASAATPGALMLNNGFAPAGIRQIYGIDQLLNKGDNGKGQTIALIDAYDDPDPRGQHRSWFRQQRPAHVRPAVRTA